MLKELGILLFVLFIVGLWITFFKISKKSYALGIQNDPFRTPVFVLCWLATIGCLSVILDVMFDWTKG